MQIQSHIDVVNEFIERLGIEKEIISKDFSKISGGQKQRIIIAICLSLDKKIFLMDEPTSSLDDASIHLLIKVVHSLNGKTVVSASHNRLWVNSADKKINL
jgi:polar amino acid transport system ATP-binding protein/putative ABC transport system ATP-binding protein